jgi:hypothetical protein
MNETPVYNAVLMEVRVELGTAHYVTVTQAAATGHLYHHTHVGSLSNWVLLLHKLHYLMNTVCHFPLQQQCTCGQVTQQVQFIQQAAMVLVT